MINKKELRREIYMHILPNIIWGKPLNRQQEINFKIWKKEFEIQEDYLKFYLNKNVLFEIVKYLSDGNKEFCIGGNIRWLMANKIEHLMRQFYLYELFEKPKKLYAGLSRFSSRPIPPISVKDKKEWQKNVWTGGKRLFEKCVNGMEFGIDIDGKDIWDSYEEAKKIFKLFKKYNLRFSIWCSSTKGWHFIVPFKEFDKLIDPFNIENVVVFTKSIALDIKDKLKLRKIDVIVYSSTRYFRLPYAISPNNNRVIYPLTDSEFLDFKEEFLSFDYVLNKKDLGFRGVFCGRKSNPNGFKKMVGEL